MIIKIKIETKLTELVPTVPVTYWKESDDNFIPVPIVVTFLIVAFLFAIIIVIIIISTINNFYRIDSGGKNE